MCVPIFSEKGGGYFLVYVSGRFPKKAWERGVFWDNYILSMVTNTQDRGGGGGSGDGEQAFRSWRGGGGGDAQAGRPTL